MPIETHPLPQTTEQIMLRNIQNFNGCVETTPPIQYTAGSKRPADVLSQLTPPAALSWNNPYISMLPLAYPQLAFVPASASSSDIENAPKKPRLGSRPHTNPSKVLHINGIPEDSTDVELHQLFAPFGQVARTLFMRPKKQAFVEMSTLSQAEGCINCVQNGSFVPRIRNVVVELHFSNTYKQLTKQGGEESDVTPVLHINVDNIVSPLSIELFKSIFSSYGNVQKIITFSKNNQFQCLIEFDNTQSASDAKLAMNGRCLFEGGCVLRIAFSKMRALNVKYNNEKSRDFTNPHLPHGDNYPTLTQLAAPQPLTLDTVTSPAPVAQYTSPLQSALQDYSNLYQQHYFPAMPGFTQFNPLGFQYQYPFANLGALDQTQLYTLPLTNVQIAANNQPQNITPLIQPTMGLPTLSPSAGSLISNGSPPLINAAVTSPVVLITQLNKKRVTPDALFTLFGLYGDVVKVKILYHKLDTALLQYTDPYFAAVAIRKLDRLRLWGNEIRVIASRHAAINPQEQHKDDGDDSFKLTQDYTNSPLHKYKTITDLTTLQINPPSPNLLLNNIPNDINENDQIFKRLVCEFNKYGKVVRVRIRDREAGLCVMEMWSVEHAAHALIGATNFEIIPNHKLKISFAEPTMLK